MADGINWMVGWNRPSWSADIAQQITYPEFKAAFDGFVAILKGEGSRQVLTDYQRNTLDMAVSILAQTVPGDGQYAEIEECGFSILVGKYIFWITIEDNVYGHNQA